MLGDSGQGLTNTRVEAECTCTCAVECVKGRVQNLGALRSRKIRVSRKHGSRFKQGKWLFRVVVALMHYAQLVQELFRGNVEQLSRNGDHVVEGSGEKRHPIVQGIVEIRHQ